VLSALVTVLCRRETERAATALGLVLVDLQLRKTPHRDHLDRAIVITRIGAS